MSRTVEATIMPKEQSQRNVRPANVGSDSTSLQKYYEKGWALVIGINKYQGDYSPLANACNDAEAFAKLLTEKLGFEKENVTLRLDDKATGNIIRDWLRDELRNKTGRNDRVIFFFAGHGITDSFTKLGYIAPCDAEKDKYSRLIDMHELRRSCIGIRAKHILFILDCCFSGVAALASRGEPSGQNVMNDAYLRNATIKSAWQVLTAGASDERVADSGDQPEHSAFTAALLDGLDGEADQDKDRLITGLQLGDYVRARVSRETSQEGARGQTPFFNYIPGSQEGDFVFILPDDGKRGPNVKQGDEVDSLIRDLQNDDPDVRGKAAQDLGTISDVRVVEPLIQALRDKDAYVRRRAADALGKIGAASAINSLINTLKDRDESVRRSVSNALVTIGEPAIEHLIRALKHRNAFVRRGVAYALGKIGDTRAVIPLNQALKDSDYNVQKAADDALKLIGAR